MMRGSGATPAKAKSKVARVTPLARASGHSSFRNVAKAGGTCSGVTGAAAWLLAGCWLLGGGAGAAGLCAGALGAAFGALKPCACAIAGTSSAASSASAKQRGLMTTLVTARVTALGPPDQGAGFGVPMMTDLG